jgi:hypothetical protein
VCVCSHAITLERERREGEEEGEDAGDGDEGRVGPDIGVEALVHEARDLRRVKHCNLRGQHQLLLPEEREHPRDL